MRYFADYHTHTNFSGDSQAPMELMVKRAVELGLKELVFTDHVDYEYADPLFENIDFGDYLVSVNYCKDKYRKVIKILMGVEIGYQPHVESRIEELLDKVDFDFVIYSTHMADRLDFYTGAFFEGKERDLAYNRYFENVLQSIKNPANFNVYGHLDFIVRYGNYDSKSLSYQDHAAIIDKILRDIIYGGCGIEVNTSGYRYGLGQMHPQADIIRRYYKLGGEIITIGSDAHHPRDLCADFNSAYTLLREIGFKYINAYEGRKARFVKIP
ncbi:MAG: histidinol-phosphatase HisJ family protein [Syntrophomonadaceae bacterium]|jgi:histidinol-phosphatase (PHP family)|nr:histidinol-phosphatase HisJ family protein [Syntrophomonadaceae bacterium]